MRYKNLAFLGLLTCMLFNTSCSGLNIKVNPDQQHYLLGISQLVRHEALDAASQGFKDTCKELLEKEGRDVSFLEVNSQGESSLCTVAASALVSQNVDLMLANATPSFQAAVNVTRTIPIVGNSITSYESALGRKIKDNIIGTNATGVTDLPPLKKQAEMLFDLVKNVEKIGLLYCSSEANSLYQIDEVEKFIKDIALTREMGVTITRYSFVDSNDIEQVARKAAIDNDVLYVPTDNTIASCSLTLKAACKNGERRTPVICGDLGTCRNAGIATLTIDYYDLGVTSGKMAVDILLGKQEVNNMPIHYSDNYAYRYNRELCKEAGIEIDERFKDYTVIE